MKYFNEVLGDELKELFATCKYGNALKELLAMTPEAILQLAIFGTYDWTVTQREGVSFSKFVFPGELKDLVPPKRVTVASGNAALDLLDRSEFVEVVEAAKLNHKDGKIPVWGESDFIKFTNAFYSALKIRSDNVSTIEACREEIILTDSNILNYGAKINGEYCANDKDYEIFPFALTGQFYLNSKYNESMKDVRNGYLTRSLKHKILIDDQKTK